MSAEPARVYEPGFDDGGGDPPTAAEIAALLAAILDRVRRRGPFFRKAVDDETAAVQADCFQYTDTKTEET